MIPAHSWHPPPPTAPFTVMHSAPSFTAVPARQTLQRPSTKVAWSPAVREYVQRAFDADNAIAGIDQKAMQEKLKVVITQAAETGRIDHLDWSTHPLPQHLIQSEREQAVLYGEQDAILANINRAVQIPVNGASSPGLKRKSPDTDMTDQEKRDVTPPWKKKATKNALEDRITGKKENTKKQKKIDAFRANAVASNDALERRKQRFGYVSPEPSPYLSSRGDSPAADNQSGPVVGTCQKLEKNYFRLTSAPKPEDVRPLPILEQMFDYLRKKWKEDHNYAYACDQFKSMRQDLTVQHIKTAFTVKVYEAHARIALEMRDLGEYNQCQTQLRALYRLNLAGRPEECTAYRSLYFIYTCNRTDMNDVLADLTPAEKKMPGVKHALQVRAALASGNYHKFFRLYDEAPFMGPYLLDMFIERERLAALAAICKAYVYLPRQYKATSANNIADTSQTSACASLPKNSLSMATRTTSQTLMLALDNARSSSVTTAANS